MVCCAAVYTARRCAAIASALRPGRYQFIRFSGNVQDRLTNFRSCFFAQRPGTGFGDTAKAIGVSVPAISERSVWLVRYPYLFFEFLTIVDTRDTACQGGVPRLLAAVVADTASRIPKSQFRCFSAILATEGQKRRFAAGVHSETVCPDRQSPGFWIDATSPPGFAGSRTCRFQIGSWPVNHVAFTGVKR